MEAGRSERAGRFFLVGKTTTGPHRYDVNPVVQQPAKNRSLGRLRFAVNLGVARARTGIRTQTSFRSAISQVAASTDFRHSSPSALAESRTLRHTCCNRMRKLPEVGGESVPFRHTQ